MCHYILHSYIFRSLVAWGLRGIKNKNDNEEMTEEYAMRCAQQHRAMSLFEIHMAMKAGNEIVHERANQRRLSYYQDVETSDERRY